MAFLQGNTYQLPVQLADCSGDIISGSTVEKGQFIFGSITKYFKEDGSGEVSWDEEQKSFIMPLTETETFAMKKTIKWQVRLQFLDGTIDGTLPKEEYVFDSITQTHLGDGEETTEDNGGV